MVFSRKEQWRIFLAVNGILIFAVLLFPLYYKFARILPIGKCGMLEYMHMYCPACGGTRSFAALMRLDLLNALKFNPIVPIGTVFFALYEVVMIKHLVKGGDREMCLKPWMVFVFIGVWLLYFVVRNLLLLYGIDILGDIIK